jgi:hypothetical protein
MDFTSGALDRYPGLKKPWVYVKGELVYGMEGIVDFGASLYVMLNDWIGSYAVEGTAVRLEEKRFSFERCV